MKKYNIPVNWIQKGVITINGETLQDAVDKATAIDFSSTNVVGQTAPDTTRVAYNGISTYVLDERLYDEVILFTSSKVPSCPFCEKAEEWLRKHKIAYKVVDVMLDEKAADRVFGITASMAMPQLQVGNEILVGFIEEQAEAAFTHYGYIQPKQPTPKPNGQPNAPSSPKIVKLDEDKETVGPQ